LMQVQPQETPMQENAQFAQSMIHLELVNA